MKKPRAQRKTAPPVMTSITRSFSYKLNVGNYESRDFFCSQNLQCELRDAATNSQMLYEFCEEQVLSAVKQYREKMARQRGEVAA